MRRDQILNHPILLPIVLLLFSGCNKQSRSVGLGGSSSELPIVAPTNRSAAPSIPDGLVGTWMASKPGEDTGIFDPEKTTIVLRVDATGAFFQQPIQWRMGASNTFYMALTDPRKNQDRTELQYSYILSGDTLTLEMIHGMDSKDTPRTLYRKR